MDESLLEDVDLAAPLDTMLCLFNPWSSWRMAFDVKMISGRKKTLIFRQPYFPEIMSARERLDLYYSKTIYQNFTREGS